jgi:Ca2+-binding RTX toxin-like protein
MTTTPTVWKAAFQLNIGAVGGVQVRPTPIGLANGNILAGWFDNTFGPSPGDDISAQLFDAQGNKIGGFLQLNTVSTADNEDLGDIKALPGGGFIVAYVDDQGAGADIIRLERYDAGGVVVFSTFVAAGGVVSEPKLSVAPNGNYMLTFTRDNAGDLNVRANIFNGATNAATAEFDAAGNGADRFRDGESAGLSNNNFVVVTQRDVIAGTDFIEFKIVNSTGAQVVAPTTVAANNSFNPDVAALTGGGFVVSYTRSNDVFFRIATNAGALGAEVTIASGANTQNFTKLVALKDGGFFVVWEDQTASDLIGQRYSATGVTIGGNVLIDATVGSSQHEVSLTSDGRILVTWFDGEPTMIILDPRDGTADGVINGTAAGEVITSQIVDSTVNGLGGDDTILGQGGNDILNGGAGTDTVSGGNGDDRFIVLEGEAIDNVDGGSGTDTLDLSAITSRSAVINFGGQSYDLVPAFNIQGQMLNVENAIGTQLGDTITGTSGSQIIEGRGGNDTLSGGLDNDTLRGGDGNDTLDGGSGNDAMVGGIGDDTYVITAANDSATELNAEGIDTVKTSLTLTLGNHLDKLVMIGSDAINATGNNLSNTMTGNFASNTLTGLDGSDRLDGNQGADTMIGGIGNEIYFVDNVGDVIIENFGEGTDLVRSFIDFSLAALPDVEEIELQGVAALNATGNDGANRLVGNNGANTILGGAGADSIRGNFGADTLTGENGADVFLYIGVNESGPSAKDTITDFGSTVDKLDFSGIDADTTTAGIQDFIFDIDGILTTGEIRISPQGGTNLIVEVNNDADAAVEMAIILANIASISQSDFII